MASIQQDQYFFVTPPRASNLTRVGGVAAVATSATAGVFDLRTLNPQVYSAASADGGQTLGPIGQFLTVEAYGSDLGICFGQVIGDVTAGRVPVIATVGTVNGSGVYTDASGIVFVIPAGQNARFILQKERDIFMGFVASAAGTMRLFQSCPSGITSST